MPGKATGKIRKPKITEAREADTTKEANRISEEKAFDTLVPEELKPRVTKLIEHSHRSHLGLRATLDEIADIATKYATHTRVAAFLQKTKKAGRKPKNSFQPFFKWLCPHDTPNNVSEWSAACEAASYFKMPPSEAITSIGGGNLRKLIKEHRIQAGLITNPKPKSEPTPPPKAEPAPNQNSRTTGTDLHVDPDLFKQMPIGRAVLDEPMRYRGRYVFIVDRPTEEAVFHVFAVRRLGEEEQN